MVSPSPSRPSPPFLYGTAWKEDETERLVRMALDAGFRGLDTANQRRHYHEAGVGRALARAFADGVVAREDLFLQTKFTYLAGQDHRLPYDPEATPAEQVRQSFESSLEHLGVEALDSYVLHGPSQQHGLAAVDWEVWAAMEELHAAGRTRFLGVSNVQRDQLEELCSGANVPPTFVQNRCFAQRGWDRDVRDACRARGIVYQGFSLLTANPFVVRGHLVLGLARGLERTPEQVVFRFAQQVGMLPLTGTSSAEHARLDLAVEEFTLPDAAVEAIESVAG